ncbi:hypothetical protein NP493_895g02026 [Ridgeia piscesae]|uniref:Uncharacterized protein n=1 Tax=Ridgeia piscesae TaxID=27915 RepID=A0AAD9NLP6_RIDPI|nr:hypothetical protein NP493_895g02026 [Ridgeia piscesae]
MEEATGKGEEAAKCKGYLRNLRSLNFKRDLHFMMDVLNILTDVSCAFQNDDLLITDIAVKLGAGCLKLNALRQLNGKVFAEYTASEETILVTLLIKMSCYVEGNIYLSTFQQQQNITFSNIYIYIYALYIYIYIYYIYIYIYIYIYNIYNMTKIYPCDKTLGRMMKVT